MSFDSFLRRKNSILSKKDKSSIGKWDKKIIELCQNTSQTLITNPIISQLIRSSLSIVLNIAEGSGKNSDKELNRYIEISLGSLSELLAAVDVLKDNKFIINNEFDVIYKEIYNNPHKKRQHYTPKNYSEHFLKIPSVKKTYKEDCSR